MFKGLKVAFNDQQNLQQINASDKILKQTISISNYGYIQTSVKFYTTTNSTVFDIH